MKKTLIASFSFLMTHLVVGQTVSTHAGKQYVGSGKYTGLSSSPILQDYYSNPYGIAIDTSGHIWISDQHNMVILYGGNSILRGGDVLDPTEPGAADRKRGTGIESRFNNPRGVYIHPKTNKVYLCDTDNGQIRSGFGFVNVSNPSSWDGLNRNDPNDDDAFAGKYTFLGDYQDGLKSAAYFSSPEDLVITSDGTMYVADYGNDCIRKISGSNVTTFAGKGLTFGDADGIGANARFYAPAGICLEGTNNLLVADRNNGKIKRINLTTAQVTTVVSGLTAPSDVVAVDGLIFIADNYCIKMWDGTKLRVYAGKAGVSDYKDGNDSNARFGELGLMAYRSKDKSIYVCDRENNVIRRIPIIQAVIPNFICNNVSPTVGQTVKLTNKSSFFTSVTWSISPSTYTIQAGGKLTDTVLYVSFNATGSYNVTLTASNPSGSVPLTRNNYINVSTNSSAKPAVDFIAVKTLLAPNETAQFVDMSANTPTKWDWTITPRTFAYTGGTDSTKQFPQVNFTASGTYTVKLVATNSNGNGTLTRTNYIVIASNGNQQTAANNMMIYPNPTRGIVHLSGVQPNLPVMLITADGKSISKVMDGNKLDITDLPDGLYVAKFPQNGLTCRLIKLN